MPTEYGRRTGRAANRILLAALLLALAGAGVGYGLGTAAAHADRARATRNSPPASPPGPSPAAGPTGPHCPAATEQAAGGKPLYQLLYLNTANSEVWICQDAAGRLYYQGHSKDLGADLVQGTTALFLSDVVPEGTGGYVATNTDTGGRITRYHVTPRRLIKEFPNHTPPTPAITEDSVP